MKRRASGVPLDEVFAEAEKRPRWKELYAKADLEVRMALEISSARKKAGMTQRQLAEAVGTTQSVISRIEQANQNLTLETLSRIAAALKVELDIRLTAARA